MILDKAGTYPLEFYDAASLTRYKIVNDFEQVLYLSKGDNLHRDFIVERITK